MLKLNDNKGLEHFFPLGNLESLWCSIEIWIGGQESRCSWLSPYPTLHPAGICRSDDSDKMPLAKENQNAMAFLFGLLVEIIGMHGTASWPKLGVAFFFPNLIPFYNLVIILSISIEVLKQNTNLGRFRGMVLSAAQF